MSTGVTNFFFNNFQSSKEQDLIQNLVTESISIYGHDVYYIPRTLNNFDPVYGSDDVSTYDKAIMVAMYIENVYGFEGDKEFMSKFGGPQIKDQITLAISRRVYTEEIGDLIDQPSPKQGDLIFFTVNQRCFKIVYVEKYEMFYQMGSLQSWKFTCELFDYNNETINTGVPEIDSIMTKLNTNSMNWAILNEDGLMLVNEDGSSVISEKMPDIAIIGDDSVEIQTESEMFVDFSTIDPFSEGSV
jgi:hypothetical protein